MKRLVLVSALALALASPGAAQQMLNLRDADIRAFIQDAARVTGRTFIIDPRVQGKVSVVTDRPLSRTEYLDVFLSTLRANGLVAVPTSGGAFRVQPADTAAAQPGRVGTRGTSSNSFVTEVFRLQTIDAASAMETIRPLVSREGSVTANRTGNAVVVADFADNIRRIRELIDRIDRDAATTRVIALRNAGAREIAQSLQALAGAPRAGGGGGDGAAAAPAGPGVSVVAIDSSNSIALRGDPRTVARLAQIAEDLDRRAATGSEIRVIFLEHADAAQLLPVLQQLVGQPVTPASSSTTPSRGRSGGGRNGGNNAPAEVVEAVAPATSSAAPVGRGQPVIARFEGANAIVVSAPSDMQRTLGEVIRQLDTRREQVLVEAIIVEISDNAARKLGVQFLLGGLEGSAIPFAATNYSNTAPNLLTIAGAIGARELNTTTTTTDNGTTTTTTNSGGVADQLAQAAVASILGAGGGFFGLGGKTDNGTIFGAIVNAVRSDTESNILSTPSVMTLDNQEAKLLVGQEIPVTTGQALSNNFDNAFRTVQRQNVGVQLEVKPQINAGGAIKLFLRQEVSSIAGPVSNDNSELILNKREIETTVTVDDGEIIALGGLLDDNERKTIERIPLLSDIPGIGELFKSRSRSRTKTNLMVFIRPRIVRSAEDARIVAAQRYGYIRDMQAAQRPEREPTIDEMVRGYMGAEPPAPGAVPAQPEIITPSVRSSREVVRPVPVPPSKDEQ
ncbi:type II secretion system protein D [Sphingomonas sp. MM-1]|uniref:type II secretion system secretin GspD n=1 Tax=Sphingomonas sp. MM-1 TaxID=745310 RepID=UPI0002C12ADC|nr:type II secretion system secretin GspD [Sphingomonas sp. MM-1]AGH47790.1 type II secretion system protein D [Sphingomonas sp. MM-1]